MTDVCVSKLTIFGSDNGLSSERRQAIIWTSYGVLSIGNLETNFNEILNEIHTFSFKKMHLNTSSAKWRPFCLGLNMLNPLISFILNRYHYDDVIMTTTVSLITSLMFVYWAVNSDTDQRKHQSYASLAFVRGIHRGPVNSPHKWPVTRKIFPFDDVIMRDSKQRWPSIKGANFGTQFEANILRLIGFKNYFRI